jgi:hypothetical protein
VSEIGDIASILMLNGGGSLPRKGDNPVLEALIDGALKKSQEPGFFSREAGQKRRAWLDETVNYFTPPELRGPLGLINEANPVTSMERASTASQTMLAPETSGWGRVAAGGDMLSNMAGIVAPAMVAGKAGMPAVNAIEEGLLGWAPGMPAAAGNFVADEFGGMKLYHGSPHDFDKFSMDKIGTGEGAQAYGHGLYFAEDKGVADSYRKALAPGEDQIQAVTFRGAEMPIKNPETPTEQLVLYMRQLGYTPEDAFKRAKKTFPPAMMKEIEGLSPSEFTTSIPPKYTGAGRMYEVDIAANPDDFVDIEMPLKDQPALEPALRKYWGRHYDSYMSDPYTNDGDFFRQLAQDPANKNLYLKEMREAGIPGLKYKDAGSRGADGDGSRNYVVFDDKLISIVKKYGVAGAATMLGVSQAEVAQAMEGQQ